MAVLIEAISVVVKASSIIEKYPGGWEKFEKDVPNTTLCADGEIVRLGFMAPVDVEEFVHYLEINNLVFIKNGLAEDIAVVDQQRGPTVKCLWVEFGQLNLGGDPQKRISACRLIGSKVTQVLMPDHWHYKDSLSDKFTFVPPEDTGKRLIRINKGNGVETYLDSKMRNKLYIGRTGEK